MTDHTPGGVAIPQAMTELEWVWVLTSPLTKNRDSIFLVEMKEKDDGQIRRVLPIFEEKQDAERIRERLCPEAGLRHNPQSMLLSEVGRFAAQNSAEIMLLDAEGVILAHMEAKVDTVALH